MVVATSPARMEITSIPVAKVKSRREGVRTLEGVLRIIIFLGSQLEANLSTPRKTDYFQISPEL
jgi:hypothetical protein